MKKVFSFLKIMTACCCLILTTTGCLKDNLVEQGLTVPEIYKSPKMVEIMGTPELTNSYQSSSITAFDIGTAKATLPLVFVRLASPDPADKDIQVQLEYMPSLINAYNDTNSTHYDTLPPNIFTLSQTNLMVTIPKGAREGKIDISLIPQDLIGSEFALGFRIKSVSDPNVKISGNFNNLFAIVAVKNIYDGVYTMTGTLVDQTVPTITGLYPEVVHLVTTGAQSVAMFYPVYHDYYHPISSGGSLSVYGMFSPEFNFNSSGNGTVTSVVNHYGQPATNGRSAAIDPTGTNKWDPVTKQMKVKYFLLQPGSTIRTRFDETFTYVGPR